MSRDAEPPARGPLSETVELPTGDGETPPEISRQAADYVSSSHSRLIDELRRPVESEDRQKATAVCAEVTRRALLDLAPALTLLPEIERRRAQALTTFAYTLFDFARQGGLEGERLSQINRWEFSLEAALTGDPPGQPVFVQIADLEQQVPWSRNGFDRLMSAARRRATVRRPASVEAAERDSHELGGALAELLVGEPPTTALETMAAALARILSLRMLGEDLRRHQSSLPLTDLPEAWQTTIEDDADLMSRAVRAECTRIRPLLLSSARAVPDLPPEYRRSGKYLLLAGIRLLNLLEETGGDLQRLSPQLGAASRLSLLLRARWLALDRL
jgi:phytoene/squalene synthetase